MQNKTACHTQNVVTILIKLGEIVQACRMHECAKFGEDIFKTLAVRDKNQRARHGFRPTWSILACSRESFTGKDVKIKHRQLALRNAFAEFCQ